MAVIRRTPDSSPDPSNRLVFLIKTYSVPVNNDSHVVHNTSDIVKRADAFRLLKEMARLKDRINRLEFEVRDQIKLMENALVGKPDTYDQMKRRISRLKGSLKYPGVK